MTKTHHAERLHALLLDAGKFGRLVRPAIRQPDKLPRNRDILLALGARQPGQKQGQLDILLRSEPRHQVVELAHGYPLNLHWLLTGDSNDAEIGRQASRIVSWLTPTRQAAFEVLAAAAGELPHLANRRRPLGASSMKRR